MKNEATSSSQILKTIYHNDSFIYCYLKGEDNKALKFHRTNFSYFKTNSSLF